MNEGIGFLLMISIICGTAFGVYYTGCKHEQEMAKLGYIEVRGVGTSTVLWVKP